MGKQRNLEINLLKFISLVLILLIHEKLPGRAGLAAAGIASLGVPTFFMISGYFACASSADALKARALRILKLAVLANVIYLVWDLLAESTLRPDTVMIWLRQNCSFKRLLVLLLTNESPLRGHLWFLGALLYGYLYLLFILYSNGKLPSVIRSRIGIIRYLQISSAFLLFANLTLGELLTACGINKQIPYIRNWLFCALPFMSIGYLIHHGESYIVSTVKKPAVFRLFIALLILSFPAAIAETVFVPNGTIYLSSIIACIVMFLLAIAQKGRLKNPLLIHLGNFADRYGLWIYILQIMVIKMLHGLWEQLSFTQHTLFLWCKPFIAFIVTTLCAVLITELQRVCRKAISK